jgi:hypothetical protein
MGGREKGESEDDVEFIKSDDAIQFALKMAELLQRVRPSWETEAATPCFDPIDEAEGNTLEQSKFFAQMKIPSFPKCEHDIHHSGHRVCTSGQ